MTYHVVTPDELTWRTRPHREDEPARHVAELSESLASQHVRANLWRYEPGAHGRRHVHAEQEETFVVLAGTTTMFLGDPAQRVDVPQGGVVNVAAGTALQIANPGETELLIYAYGFPPDHGATVLDSAV